MSLTGCYGPSTPFTWPRPGCSVATWTRSSPTTKGLHRPPGTQVCRLPARATSNASTLRTQFANSSNHDILFGSGRGKALGGAADGDRTAVADAAGEVGVPHPVQEVD